MPDVAIVVRATLEQIPARAPEFQRVGSCLYALRTAVQERLQLPTSLEQTIGNDQVTRYERGLGRLEPIRREAIVLRIEMKRGFPQMAEDLNISSPEEASRLFRDAFLQLAEEMANEL